jgi:acyl-coenzyme A synthetase/AMP-(fatty) acid ligase
MSTTAPAPVVNAASRVLDARARRSPARVAIVSGAGQVSYRALAWHAARTGAAFERVGCRPGDRVLIGVPDSPEGIAAFWGAIRIGAVAVLINPTMSEGEYRWVLGDAEPRVVVTHLRALADVRAAIGTSALPVIVADEEVHGGNRRASRVHVRHRAPFPVAYQSNSGDAAVMLYTSGSTGRPKGVVQSHASLLAACDNVGRRLFRFCTTDRVMSASKTFFSFGLGFGGYLPLSRGASIICDPAPLDLPALVRGISLWRPTILCAVPSVLDTLLRAGERTTSLDVSSLRFIVSAGEPLPPHVFDQFKHRYGIEVIDGIGSTEMMTHFISNRPGHARPGSCGVPVPGVDIALVDEDGAPVADGEIGALRVKAATAFIEYWRQPDLTSRTRIGDWVVTGDRLYRDAAGYFHYCGRSDDMLKVSGQWVLPSVVESVLRQFPAVERAVVTVREDPTGRRRLVAYVVPRMGTPFVAADLVRHAGRDLPEHMVPSAFVTMSALPQTPTGKLRRGELPSPVWRDNARDHIRAGEPRLQSELVLRQAT